MTVLRKIFILNHKKYLQYKGNSAKTHDKDESILSPICISETDKNDNVASDNSEDCPWPKGAICIAGDSIVSGLQTGLHPKNIKLKRKTFLAPMLETCTTI